MNRYEEFLILHSQGGHLGAKVGPRLVEMIRFNLLLVNNYSFFLDLIEIYNNPGASLYVLSKFGETV